MVVAWKSRAESWRQKKKLVDKNLSTIPPILKSLLPPQNPLQESRQLKTVCDLLLSGHNCDVHLFQNP